MKQWIALTLLAFGTLGILIGAVLTPTELLFRYCVYGVIGYIAAKIQETIDRYYRLVKLKNEISEDFCTLKKCLDVYTDSHLKEVEKDPTKPS